MKREFIKPIPKHILKAIKKRDEQDFDTPSSNKRFYAYLTKYEGELVKVTVAVRHRYGKWFCKQVAVHGVDSNVCFAKDINFYYIAGYVVGWYEEGFYKTPKWWENDGWCLFDDGAFDPNAPVINPEYALKFKEYKYSAVDKYGYCDIFKYLRLYKNNPQMEYITKLGLACIVTSKQVLTLSKKDANFRKWLSRNAAIISKNHYYVMTIMAAYKKGLDFDEVQAYISSQKALQNKHSYSELKKEFHGEIPKLLAYISKHKTSISNYDDYMKACKYLGLDFTDTKHRYPINFTYWHEVRSDEYATKKAIIDEQTRKELYEQFAKIATKYLPLEHYKNGGYVVIIAKSPAELIKEGELLHHCVGRMGYDQRMVREESLIFFIRNITEQEKPFVTIEYSLQQKKVLQCYGENNAKPERNVIEFVNEKWLPYANRQLRLVA